MRRFVWPFVRGAKRGKGSAYDIPLAKCRERTRYLGKSHAVGDNALARNPVPIIILCHRVVRTDYAIALTSGWKTDCSI